MSSKQESANSTDTAEKKKSKIITLIQRKKLKSRLESDKKKFVSTSVAYSSSSSTSSSSWESTSSTASSSSPSDAENNSNDKGHAKNKQEGSKNYKKGGYHPVRLGDLYNERYNVIRKIGWGYFSTVWLCWDIVDKRFVALKVVKSDDDFTDAAVDEIQLLRCVRIADSADTYRERNLQMLDDFRIAGVNGRHVCMVFEVLGKNLLSLVKESQYKGIPLDNVRCIARQILEGIHYVHAKCKIIHTDLKPENILLVSDADYPRRMAADAIKLIKKFGPNSPKVADLVAACQQSEAKLQPKTQTSDAKLTRNKKKKLRQKLKRKNDTALKTVPHHDAPMPSDVTAKATVPKAHEAGDEISVASSDVIQSRVITTQGDSLPSQVSTGPPNLNMSAVTSSDETDDVISVPAVVKPACDAERLPADPLLVSSSVDVVDQGNQRKPNDAVDKQKVSTRTDCVTLDEETLNKISDSPDDSSLNVQLLLNPAKEVCDINVKIADFGNACWTVFELATGDFLFNPTQHANYPKNVDHVAQFIELLGPISKNIALTGKFARDYFNRRGQLRYTIKLRPRSLVDLLQKRHHWTPDDAAEFADFLLPMLEYDPRRRATAEQCLQHPWLIRRQSLKRSASVPATAPITVEITASAEESSADGVDGVDFGDVDGRTRDPVFGESVANEAVCRTED